jgi:hypothetical protein
MLRLDQLKRQRRRVLDDEIGLVRHVIHFGVGAHRSGVEMTPSAMKLLRHPQFEGRPLTIPSREPVGVHVDKAVVVGAAWPLGVGDEALAFERAVFTQRRRHVEVHLVGVIERDAPRLTAHPLNRVIRQGGFEGFKDLQRLHGAELAAQLRDDVKIVLIVGATVGDRGVDRYRPLRVEIFDLVVEGGRRFQVLANRLVPAFGLVMERRRKLNAQSDLREDAIQRIVKRANAREGELRVQSGSPSRKPCTIGRYRS